MSAATPRPNGTARATASTSIASTAAPARSRHVQRSGRIGEPVVPHSQCGRHAALFGAWRSDRSQFLHHRSADRPYRAAQPAIDRWLQSRAPCLRRNRPLPCRRQLRHGFAGRAAHRQGRQPPALPHAYHGNGDAGAAPRPAAHHVRASHPARSPGPLLLRAVQGLRCRHRLSPRPQAPRAGRSRARDRPSRRRAASHRFPSEEGAGLRHQ